MILHFIFMVKQEDVDARQKEFAYVTKMASFFGDWIADRFGVRYETRCDMMTVSHRSILQRPDTHSLLRDHRQRGADIYHFYLAYFRPLWTDCTCEGYHAENFGMVWWQRERGEPTTHFMAEKNCTAVSHELAHELLRQSGHARYVADVHDVWTRHFYSDLAFESYGANHKSSKKSPLFMTIHTADLV